MMKILILVLTFAFLEPPAVSLAQVPAGNEVGVAMGHLHLNVRDVEANKKFFAALGGSPVKVPPFEVVKFPDVLVILNLAPGNPPASGGMVGTVINHFGFRVSNLPQSVDKFRAAGLKVDVGPNPGQAFTYTPDDIRFEIVEDKTLAVPIAFHHIHFWVTEAAVPEIKAWYVKMFGAKPGMRLANQAADLPGVNLTFSKSSDPMVGTKGHLLDHIGFEIKNLEAFCRKLEANGVKLDRPYTKTATGLGLAFLTDPWGTTIELNEGLDRW
jgi:catechol 2,3-dioxygenase-like lactoylglutathione lyase family enzyme